MKNIISFLLEKLSEFNVWIMCGLPGSGKSTYIKEELSKNIEIINQDSIRVELGIMDDVEEKKLGNKEQEKEVSRICLERIDKAIKERKDFAIDNAQISDEETLRTMIKEIIANNKEQQQSYLNGRSNLFDYFVGQVMKQTKGKANPVMTKQILKEELEK